MSSKHFGGRLNEHDERSSESKLDVRDAQGQNKPTNPLEKAQPGRQQSRRGRRHMLMQFERLRTLFRRLSCACGGLLAIHCLASDPLDTWMWRNPQPTGEQLFQITYLNGQFIALGGEGTVLTSPDGITWRQANGTDSHDPYQGISFGNGHYILSWGYLAGTGTFMLASSNSMDWSPYMANPPSNQSADQYIPLLYTNGLFLGVGDATNQSGSAIFTSPDGTNWTQRASGHYGSMAYGKGVFVAVSGIISVSTNGMDWFQLSLPTLPSLDSVAYGNGIFVAIFSSGSASFITSVDGTNWVNRASGLSTPFTRGSHGVGFGNGKFVSLDYSGNNFRSSADGIHWSETSFTGAVGAICVTGGNGLFVAAGEAGQIASSPDGTNWTTRCGKNIAPDNTYGVAFGRGRYVVGGGAGLITSTDGIHWSGPLQLSGANSNVTVNSISYVNNLFVAGGGSTAILISQDGINWTSANTSGARSPNVYQTIYENNLFVAVADFGILTSPDGTNWSSRSFSNVSLRSISYGNGQFVVVGGGINANYGGTILMSQDATNWTELDDLTPYAGFNGTAFGNGEFVVVAGDGTVFTSPDGVTWPLPSGPGIDTSDPYSSGSLGVNGLVYGDGQFVASGIGTCWNSTDGRSWTRHTVFNLYDVSNGFGLRYQNGSYWALGSFGAVLECRVVPQLLAIQWQSDKKVGLELSGVAGKTNSVQASADLTNWITLGDVTLTNGMGQFLDASATNFTRRFYRAVAR